MGKKSKWFGAMKKVFSPESKEKKKEKDIADQGSSAASYVTGTVAAGAAAATPLTEEVKVPVADVELEQTHQSQQVAAPAGGTATDALAPPILAAPARVAGISPEEASAIKIQTAFRGYLARRALRALRGLSRLQSLIQGNSVKRQATSTLRCMQALSRVQSQIRSRRLKMSEENQALQRQLMLKKELESLQMGEQWDDSLQSKEQIEASLVNRQEAAARRERALAYAFSHQWKNSSRSANPMFVDPNNPQWGWSWLERWMAAKPWEGRAASEKEANTDRSSVKSTAQSLAEGEITRAYSRRDSKPDKPSPATPKLTRPASQQTASTPSPKITPVLSKKKSSTPKNGAGHLDDDVHSMISIKSEKPRRHSIGVATAGDDESMTSSPAVPSYMAPTESARAKSRLQSPLSNETTEVPEKAAAAASAGSIKKRLSFAANEKNAAASPALARRHSGPPKVETAIAKNVEVQSEA